MEDIIGNQQWYQFEILRMQRSSVINRDFISIFIQRHENKDCIAEWKNGDNRVTLGIWFIVIHPERVKMEIFIPIFAMTI